MKSAVQNEHIKRTDAQPHRQSLILCYEQLVTYAIMAFTDDDDEPPDAVALGLCRYSADSLPALSSLTADQLVATCADSVQPVDPAVTPAPRAAPLDSYKSVPVTLITGKSSACTVSESAP